jgi:hypothetical protein
MVSALSGAPIHSRNDCKTMISRRLQQSHLHAKSAILAMKKALVEEPTHLPIYYDYLSVQEVQRRGVIHALKYGVKAPHHPPALGEVLWLQDQEVSVSDGV